MWKSENILPIDKRGTKKTRQNLQMVQMFERSIMELKVGLINRFPPCRIGGKHGLTDGKFQLRDRNY